MSWTGFGGGGGGINSGNQNMASGNPSSANYGGGGGTTGLGGNGGVNRNDYNEARSVISGMGLVGTAVRRDAAGNLRSVGIDSSGQAAWNTASEVGSARARAMSAAIGGYGGGSSGTSGGNGGKTTNTYSGQTYSTKAQQQKAQQQAAAQAQAAEQARQAEAARAAEAARVKEANRVAQVAERDKAVGMVQSAIDAGSRTYNQVKGIYDTVNKFVETAGGLAKHGTVAGSLYTGLRDAYRGFSMLGPVGGILGAVYGLAEGAGALDKMTLDTLKGYNPNGEGGVTSAGDLAQRVGPFWNTRGNSGDHETQTTTRTNGPSQPTPKDKQAAAAINQLIPQSARNMIEAGEAASNSYLKALRGRYAKYMLATGAEGSGTSLLQRTAGGVGALGGVTGQLLYSRGGNQ